MLDSSLVDQLRTHFSALQSTFTFAVRKSEHAKQAELVELLSDVAQASDKLHIIYTDIHSQVPCFDLLKNGAPTGVRFRGIPAGHEFTSLILAILNANGTGRLPDEGLQKRIKGLSTLKGPIHLRTYISLSCTNCPDVVQSLNQMALLHDQFTHEMVDGELSSEEVQRLGIQGVPAVFDGEKLLHVGKASLGELLETLENHFGVESKQEKHEIAEYDVVVIGGGPAGSSAAIYSARKGLKTAIVAQKLGGQVNDTLGIENLISVNKTEGPKLASDLLKHLKDYPISLLDNRRVESVRDIGIKEITLQGGEVLHAKSLILATGAKWRELGVPGEKEHIGRGVAFCPHCDGPFFKGRRVAVVGGGNSGVEAAIDLAGICSTVTLLEFSDQLKADRVLIEKLYSLPNVQILLNARTSEVKGDGTSVSALAYQDRITQEFKEVLLDGVFVQIGLVPNSSIVKDLVETNRMGEILIDEKCRTNVPGIYAAGDVTTVPFKQIIIAMGEGAKAALSAFEDRMRKTN